MENATSKKNISDIHSILNELMRNAKIIESRVLAETVQKALIENLTYRGYRRVKNKGVKEEPFYVLLWARMPGELTVQNELLWQRVRKPGALAKRRSSK